MDDTTIINQNILPQVNNTPVAPVLAVNPIVPQVSSNPFLDKLNLNKYDELLADFELKNPDLANKAKNILATEKNQIVETIPNIEVQTQQAPTQVVSPIVEPIVPLPIQPIEPVQNIALPQQVPTQVVSPIVEPSLPLVNPIVPAPIDQQVNSAIPNPAPQVDPSILTQSFQQFPNGSENNQLSGKQSPEYQSAANEAGNEKQVEKIVEELKSIEKSPEETNEKVKETPKVENPIENNNKDVPNTKIPEIEKIKVYGYQIPQKILELGSKVNDLASRSDLGSAKTWLYILVGRVIAKKNASKNKDSDNE